jgi:hypothetical protein
MKLHRSEPPSAGTPADDQAEDTAMPIARGVREWIERASTETPADDQAGDTATPKGIAKGAITDKFSSTTPGYLGLLIPGTKDDEVAKEVGEANRKAEEADPESKRRRQKRDAVLTARLARILGKTGAERAAILDKLDRQEELLRDARDYAEITYLSEPHSSEARRKLTQRIWDEFIPRHKDKDAFSMGFRDLHAAIWPEDDPSLEEPANNAGEDESADTQTRPLLSGTEGGETDPERPGDTLPVVADEAAPKPATVAIGGKSATAWTDVKIRSEEMQPGGDSRPTLPLDTQAVIERTKQGIIDARKVLCPHLFQPLLVMDIGSSLEPPPVRKTANVKIELGLYSSLLFDSEAEHYPILAGTGGELGAWLEALASSVQNEVMADTQRCSPRIHLHCSASERREAIREALAKRIDHWCDCFRKNIEGVSFTALIPGHPGLTRRGSATVKPATADHASEIAHIQEPTPNADQAVLAHPATVATGGTRATAWKDVEICFLDAEHAQVTILDKVRELSYAEMGFGDRRGMKVGDRGANMAWGWLQRLAETRGVIEMPERQGAPAPKGPRDAERRPRSSHEVLIEDRAPAAKARAKLHSAMKQLRRRLCSYFGIKANPILFEENRYCAQFRIGRSPSYHQ